MGISKMDEFDPCYDDCSLDHVCDAVAGVVAAAADEPEETYSRLADALDGESLNDPCPVVRARLDAAAKALAELALSLAPRAAAIRYGRLHPEAA